MITFGMFAIISMILIIGISGYDKIKIGYRVKNVDTILSHYISADLNEIVKFIERKAILLL